jgi:hypothetical protein
VIGLLDVSWTSGTTIVIPSARTIAEALSHPDSPCEEDAQELTAWLKAPGPNGGRSWLQTFNDLRKRPAKTHASLLSNPSFTWNFDELCTWSRAFRALTPISSGRFAGHALDALEHAGVKVPSPQFTLDPVLPCRIVTSAAARWTRTCLTLGARSSTRARAACTCTTCSASILSRLLSARAWCLGIPL